MARRCYWLEVLSLLAVCWLYGCEAGPDNNHTQPYASSPRRTSTESAAPARACYDAVKSAGATVRYGQDPYETPLNYWEEVLARAHFKLWECLAATEEAKRADAIEGLVLKFGVDGADGDMRLLGSDFTLTVPHIGKPNGLPLPKGARLLRNPEQEYDEICSLFWKYQTERFLERPDLRARYYHFVLWLDSAVGPYRGVEKLAQATDEGFRNDACRHYWFYARNFLVLATATNREDLLEDTEPDDLKERFKQWYKWYQARHDSDVMSLVFDEKSNRWKTVWGWSGRDYTPPDDLRPFEDWDCPIPPPPAHVRLLLEPILTAVPRAADKQ